MLTPIVVRLKTTLAKGMGSLVNTSVTFPVIIVTCANEKVLAVKQNKKQTKNFEKLFLITNWFYNY